MQRTVEIKVNLYHFKKYRNRSTCKYAYARIKGRPIKKIGQHLISRYLFYFDVYENGSKTELKTESKLEMVYSYSSNDGQNLRPEGPVDFGRVF